MSHVKGQAAHTKWLSESGCDGVAAGEVESRAKELVEAAGEVNRWAGQVTASLASEERMSLHLNISWLPSLQAPFSGHVRSEGHPAKQ